MGELYNIVNVPTVIWIDQKGRIARPNDVAFTTEEGGRYAQVSTDEQMALLRAWVRGELEAKPETVLRDQVAPVSREASQARAMFGLGWWLYQRGQEDEGLELFREAGKLAPEDFTIRRGTMRYRGANPFGPEFAAMVGKWLAKGKKYYLPLKVE